MEQLDLLWRYQEIELELDQLEMERKNSPLRQQLGKLRNYVVEQQNIVVGMNEEIENRIKKYDMINSEYESLRKQLEAEQESLQSGNIKSAKQIERFRKVAEEMKASAAEKEKLLMALISEIEELYKNLREIGNKITKGKREYTQKKNQYDAENQKIQDAIQKLNDEKKEIGSKLDKDILKRYENVKLSHNMAMAKIDAEKCSGCNMSLASLVIRNVKDAKKIVECENCGRILYLP